VAADNQQQRIWVKVLWRLGAVLLLGVVLSPALGGLANGMLLVLVPYVAWHIYNLYLVERWLRSGNISDVPDSWGVWRAIFDRIYRLQQAERLRQRELGRIVRRFRKSSSALPDGVVVLDDAFRIDWFNDAAKILLSLKKKKDTGQRISNLVRDPRFVDYLTEGDYSRPVEIGVPDQPGAVLSLQIVPYDSDQYLLTVRNVSRLHKLEQLRRDFVANASHELRTPLTVMRGYVDALDDEVETLPPHWQKAWQAVAKQTNHMQRLVRDLMVTLRLEDKLLSGRDQIIDMQRLCDDATQELKALAGPDIELVLKVDARLMLRGDVTEIQSIVGNLVGNAINYMPQDYESGQGVVKLKWQANNKGAVLVVSDNGAGIAKKHLAHITERFYRVDNRPGRIQQGTGLGLTIVTQALRRHGGKLSVKSKVGQGTVFKCQFPKARVLTATDNNLLKTGS
jgi:two-component system phosphate regulon sensor histidine kinase PhoR